MLRILVLSPFRHVFRNKDIWLTANEAYHLDPVKDKDEVKHFLSDSFPFTQYIHFDKENLDKALLNEASEEGGFTPVGPPEDKLRLEETHFPTHESFTTPIQDMEPNYFAHKVEAPKLHKPSNDPVLVESAEEPLKPVLSTSNKFPEAETFKATVVSGEKEKGTRKDELSLLHWRKLKDVAEGYGIEYTDKETVVKEIITLEYK